MGLSKVLYFVDYISVQAGQATTIHRTQYQKCGLIRFLVVAIQMPVSSLPAMNSAIYICGLFHRLLGYGPVTTKVSGNQALTGGEGVVRVLPKCIVDKMKENYLFTSLESYFSGLYIIVLVCSPFCKVGLH